MRGDVRAQRHGSSAPLRVRPYSHLGPAGTYWPGIGCRWPVHGATVHVRRYRGGPDAGRDGNDGLGAGMRHLLHWMRDQDGRGEGGMRDGM
jgi:hypothetical protein